MTPDKTQESQFILREWWSSAEVMGLRLEAMVAGTNPENLEGWPGGNPGLGKGQRDRDRNSSDRVLRTRPEEEPPTFSGTTVGP